MDKIVAEFDRSDYNVLKKEVKELGFKILESFTYNEEIELFLESKYLKFDSLKKIDGFKLLRNSNTYTF
jgi:hypothetical protein